MTAQKEKKYIYWFKEITKDNIDIAGGKGANLGEMSNFNVPVPPGFIISSQAYFYFIKVNEIEAKIREALSVCKKNQPETYEQAAKNVQRIIINSTIPKEISQPVIHAYLKLGHIFSNPLVAVRSSATAEDLPDASFAGQQRTFLNVSGEVELLEKVKEAWASLFEGRAIFYREEKGFDHFKVGLAVPVQLMIQSKTSGVMFTADPVTNSSKRIIIEAIYGLGELIVQGEETPDNYIINKDSLEILEKSISSQKFQLIKKGKKTFKSLIKTRLTDKQKISDELIIKLAKIGKQIQEHYFFPQDIEWAIDSHNKIFIVQTRPITTIINQTNEENNLSEIKKAEDLIEDKKEILTGEPASPGIGWGKAIIIESKREIKKVSLGDILITSMTTPDFVPAMKKVSAIVTDRGGQTSHAAIVSRELGVPCVVGTKTATRLIKNNQVITVDGTKGKVYQGGLSIKSRIVHSRENTSNRGLEEVKTATNVYVNLAEKHLAETVAQKNVDGVGLLRAEFMIAEIGIHPKKLIHDKKEKLFINLLADGMTEFCRSFNPRPVIYRATDFKTNEYRSLKGGELFEPVESNPMLGYRGAFRYIHDEQVFALEIEAIKKVRNKLGYRNLWLMIPFVHTPEELIQVKKIIVSAGLSRTPTFKLFMMVEIPANVILLEDFIRVGIDGVSIGSNDLTMLTLGIDRDNAEVASVFDERNPAVYWMLERTIKTCRKYNITCSICGQAPSEYPEMVEKLVAFGINSISVNPDAIERTREMVYQAEKALIKNKTKP